MDRRGMFGGGGGTGRVPLPHGAPLLLLVVLFFLCMNGLCHCHGREVAEVTKAGRCMEGERKALLAVRADLGDADEWLPSWGTDDDCCGWERVSCDDQSGHVVKLHLRHPYPDRACQSISKVNPSLLNLTSLRYLDLSLNDFGGASIPSFMGSMVNLEYLNLSYARFAGSVPPQLGSLRNLQSLDLSRLYWVKVENLGWVSHLSHLQYLDLSWVVLSAATHWLQQINMLPSLSVLRLSDCGLPNLPTGTLPHVNFTSLSTLDLSDNFLSSTWPLWLFNISGLVRLDLGGNSDLHGRIPDGFGNMKRLEVLSLSATDFEGVIPGSLWMLDKLKVLSLTFFSNLRIELPESLGNLTHLESLKMYVNNFTGGIPESVGNLVNLKHLSLSSDNVDGGFLEPIEKLRNLQELTLGGVVGRLPESLRNLTHLESLQMYYTNFTGGIPESVDNLVNLKHLSLFSNINVNGGFLEPIGKLRNLQELRLGGVVGGLPESIGNITTLESLEMSDTNFTGGIPESVGNLVNLKHLSLSSDNVDGGFLEPIGKLRNLQELRLDGVVGRLPESLGNVTHLESLHLESSNIIGGIPKSLGNLSHLESLDMHDNNFTGGIPESVGNLVNLKHLWLSSNNVNGGFLESLRKLRGLKTLDLSGGNISRELLRSMGDLCNLTEFVVYENVGGGAEVNELVEGLSQCHGGGSVLETLDLRGNGFGGHLPDHVGQLHNLEKLDLSGNLIVGSIPASIGKLSNLRSLAISSPSLEGVLSEAHFTNLSRLQYLYLSHNAALSLNVSQAWVPPFQLLTFRMRACHVGPEFPKWIQTQKQLYELDLSDNVIQDKLVDNFFNSFPHMSSLNLSHNKFEASHFHLHSGSSLHSLDLSNNLISGPILVNTSEFQLLEYLDLSRNTINGSIPLSICEIKSLQVLDLSYNHLSGGIPGCWDPSIANLVVMKLSHNKLSGPIHNSLRNLSQLASLHLDKNNFSGVIPSSLKYSVQLEILDFGENKLSGEIPAWLGECLSSLQVLRLRSNMFHGNIPMSLSQLQFLQVLDLACNKLSGTLLLSFPSLSAMVEVKKDYHAPFTYSISSAHFITTFLTFEESITIVTKGTELEYTRTLSLVTIIDLSGNNFSGHIPKEITSLKGLRFLNLSWNHLEGEIPTEIGTMSTLESLDLSFNQLSGNIPSSISIITSLSHFNVSYNNLAGRIPTGSQLQTFDQSTYIGNLGLCGSPLLRHCPDDVNSQDPIFQASEEDEDKHDPYMIWFYIGMGTGFAVGFWGFLGMLLLSENKRIGYFRFIDSVADGLYVMAVVHFARMEVKISSWILAKFAT